MKKNTRRFSDHLDYIIILLIAVIALLVSVYAENNANISGKNYKQITDFDSRPLENCDPFDKENIAELSSSNPSV
ncbi:MAG: hypothetical protein HY513_01130, partial [Candidatus Aenigmarchaeota archaeon]|nr:hypothetical protein [Candidatus Aenigmarchaeota archaeon]